MHKHVIQPHATCGRSVAEIIEQRDAALARVRAMLIEKPLTVHDVCVGLGVARGVGYRLMKYLSVHDEAHPTHRLDAKRRELWAAGPSADKDKPKGEAVRVAIIPAEQVGAHRDPLVQALFGPARGAAA